VRGIDNFLDPGLVQAWRVDAHRYGDAVARLALGEGVEADVGLDRRVRRQRNLPLAGHQLHRA